MIEDYRALAFEKDELGYQDMSILSALSANQEFRSNCVKKS